MTNSKKNIIIDTDMGWDDVLAILYLLKKSDIEILGITVTGCGETDLAWGLKIGQALSALSGKSIPVAAGSDKPLRYAHTFPQGLKDDMNTMMGLLYSVLPENPVSQEPGSAWEFMAGCLNHSAEPVTLLSLGGFTNIARLIAVASKKALSGLQHIYAMAGAVDVEGNIALLNNAQPAWDQGPLYRNNHSAEWNVFVDPLAAKRVFESDLPVTLIPLDACNQVMLTSDYPNLIYAHDRVAGLAREILLRKTTTHDEGIPVPVFDPLAAVVMAGGLTDYESEAMFLDVIVDENSSYPQCGATIRSDSGSRKLNVVQKVSQQAFVKEFANTINGAGAAS